jgi:hypothetical protein
VPRSGSRFLLTLQQGTGSYSQWTGSGSVTIRQTGPNGYAHSHSATGSFNLTFWA